jgi:branched-chain amino acid transport system permease protein
MGYFADIINLIGIYAILAMSLNVICGLTGQLQIGHAGFWAIGAYAAALLAIYVSNPAWSYLNFALGLAAAVVATAIFAVAIGLPCLRLRGDYLAIATLGFGEIVRIVLSQLEFPACDYTDEAMITSEHTRTFGGASGLEMPRYADYVHMTRNNPLPTPAEGDVNGLYARVSGWLDGLQSPPFSSVPANIAYELVLDCWFVAFFTVLTFLLLRNIKRSAIGRAFLAIREDELAARAMGVNVPLYKLLAFVLCAVFAGLAGALYAHMQPYVAPGDFQLLHTIMILLMVVLGGLGSFTGSILAAALLVALPEAMRFIPAIPLGGERSLALAEHKELIFAFLLVVLIRWVPNGFFGLLEGDDCWRRWQQRRRQRAATTGPQDDGGPDGA